MQVARVSQAGAKRVRDGHPWVFRVDLQRPADVPGGAVVAVTDETGNPLGSAFQAARSKIALRMLTRGAEPVDRAFWAKRVEQALGMRRRLWPEADAYRVIHGESDLIPGLFVDRYGDALSLQAVSEGADAHTPLFVELLREALKPRVVVARNNTSARDFEGLPRAAGVLAGGPGTEATYHEGPNAFAIDLLVDHKTGAFLDQRENHVAAAAYAADGGTALDTFSYHGGFALSLASRAAHVIAVEQDEGAAGRLRANAERNRRKLEVIHGNTFDVLRGYEREGRRFDTVVLDPPAFAKRKGDLPAAARAYKELNLRALKLLAPGGVLITCSCSGKMTAQRFAAVLEEAIADAKRPVQLLERKGAARDHPVLPLVPETEYLKCWVYRAL
jgi:23S rRNA (cytosine1962-C5)-methyltransferase